MILHVLALDYDGTIAEGGRVADSTAAALARVRESGRRLVLVTGRMLPDLRQVCPDVERMFDAIVVENGAVLYLPDRRELRVIGERPEPVLVEALRRRGVPIDLGESIIATDAPFADASLAAIRDAGVERALIFNRNSLMLLPGGVTKGTGLLAALSAMELSPRNLAGAGDAENDHAFLALCECAVAVGDAVPALRERADHVTRAAGPAGVVEFIDEHLLADGAAVVPRLRRHHLEIGRTAAGAPVTVPAHDTRLLIVGPSASGKSTLTGVLVERLLAARRTLCLIDPEGDHEGLADLEDVVTLGGKAGSALPGPDELAQLLRRPGAGCLVLNLSALSRAEKVAYATRVLGVVAAVRSASGLPHWLLVDEAHHVAPAEGSPAAELLQQGTDPAAFITLSVDVLAHDLWPTITGVASTDLEALRAAVGTVSGVQIAEAGTWLAGEPPLERGEAILARLDGEPSATRFRVATRQAQHRRHVRKYAEGELPPDRSFYFRGPQDALNLRAANLKRFCELAEGVDDATWHHHLERGDYIAWVRDVIKDPELADELAALPRDGAAADTRRPVLEAIRRRYGV